MLPVNDSKLTSFDRSDDNRRKLRPVKVIGDLVNVYGPSSADLALVRIVDHQLLDFDPLQKRRRPR
jgi:hypothetical protein